MSEARVTCRIPGCDWTWTFPTATALRSLHAHIDSHDKPQTVAQLATVTWQEQFLDAVRSLPVGKNLTTAELHALVPPPIDHHSWGGATTAAAHLGLLKAIETQKSELPTTKSSLVRRWQRVDPTARREAS